MANPESRSSSWRHASVASAVAEGDDNRISPLLIALAAVVLASPIPFASNALAFSSALVIAIGVLVGGYLLQRLASDRWSEKTLSAPLLWATVGFAAVCIWSMLQSLLPIPVEWAEPVWQMAEDLLGQPVSARLSLDPGESLFATARLASYGAVFVMAASLSRSAASAGLIFRAFIIVGGVLAAYALTVYFFFENDWVLHQRKIAFRQDLTGTYIGRNQAAAFFGLIAIVIIARLLSDLITLAKNAPSFGIVTARFLNTIATRRRIEIVVLPLVLLSLLLTHSRWGQTTFLIAVAAMILLVPANASDGRKKNQALSQWTWIALPAVILGAVVFVWFNERFQAVDEAVNNIRWETFDLVLYRIGLSPILGTGLGTFENIFTTLEGESFSRELVMNYVHNVYLENMLELGVPAAFALFAVIGLVIVFTLTRRWRRRWPEPFFVVLGASVFLGLHQLLDFSLQSPSIAVMFALLLGASAGRWRVRKRRRVSRAEKADNAADTSPRGGIVARARATNAPPWAATTLASACAVLLVCVGLWSGIQEWPDRAKRNNVVQKLDEPATTSDELVALGESLSSAGNLLPNYAWKYFNHAWTIGSIADDPRLNGDQRALLNDIAFLEQRRSVAASPANAEYWSAMSIFALRTGDTDAATAYLDQSYLLGPFDRRSRIERLWVFYNLDETIIAPHIRKAALAELVNLYNDQRKWLLWELVESIPPGARRRLTRDAAEVGIDFRSRRRPVTPQAESGNTD